MLQGFGQICPLALLINVDFQYSLQNFFQAKMSVGRSHEPLGLPQIPASSLNNPIYPPNSEDQSPINENASSSPSRIPRAIHVNGQAQQEPSGRSLKLQILFWTLILLFLIGICYYLNDNSAQAKEIDNILMNSQKAQNAEISRLKEIHKKVNLTLLNPQEPKKTAATKQIFERTGQQEKLQSVNITNHAQIKLKNYLLDQIPNRVWHFSLKSPQRSSLWTQKTLQQHKRMAVGMNYQLLTINQHDYGKYLPLQRFKMLSEMLQKIDARYKAREEPQLLKYRDLLIEQLITVEILVQNGGIYVEKDIILTEDFKWISKIAENPYVNAKQLLKKPLFIAFHSVELSSPLEYHEALPNKVPAERYMVRYPSIQSYFMVCNQNNSFLTSLRDNLYRLLQEPKIIKKCIEDYQMDIPGMEDKISFYENAFHVACQMALRSKEKQLPQKSQAISHFQLATINQKFGPAKIKAYLSTDQPDKILSHLGRFSRQQLQYQFGTLSYMLNIEPIQEIYVQLRQFAQKQKIIQTSLIHQALFNNSEDAAIKFQIVRPEVLGGEKWTDLPAKLWIYCNQQPYKTSLFNQIWIQNAKKIAQQSKFQLVILNETNLAQHISKDAIKRIDEATSKRYAKLKIYKYTRMELISFAVLYEHGGVWVSPQIFLSDNLDWLHNINKEPFIWNKHGPTPKVVLTFQPHYGSPFQWQYNKQGIKQTWHIAYQVNFIAAVPRAQLINDWLNEMIIDLGTPVQTLISRFYSCGIHNHRWTGDANQEMLAFDSIKCVLGAKNKLFSEQDNPMSPNEYYGLWAINGYAGYLKMREYTSFLTRRTMQNSMIWRYPFQQMENIAGKVNHFVRIYSYGSQGIQRLYRSTSKENLAKQFHEKSFFLKLLERINQTIVATSSGLLLETYNERLQAEMKKMEEKKKLSHIPQLLWVYLGGQIDGNDTFVKENVLQNIKHYASLSKFQVRFVDRHNYGNWLKTSKGYVDYFLKNLKQKSQKEKSNLKDHQGNIIAQYISLWLLYQNGGIAITKKLVFHQDLSWVKAPQKLKFVNKGGNSDAKVFGFFGPGYGPKRTINKDNNQEFVMFPSLQNYFIASGVGTQFIKDLLDEFQNTVMSHDKCKKRMKQIGHDSGWLHGDDPYYEALFLSSQFVISNRQKQLEGSKSKQNALDYYGLYSLNTRYYPYKLYNFVNKLQVSQQNLYQYLAKTPMAELQKEIGPLRYLSIVPRFNDIKSYVSKSFAGQKGFDILQTSFVHRHLVLSSQKNGIIKYQQPKDKQGGKEWITLPQDIWIYIPKGLKTSDLTTKLMFIHLNVTFSQAGFRVHQANDENLNKIIDQATITRIKKATSSNSNQVHAESLIKLALLQKNGGIALPVNLLLTEKPTWIKNVSALPSGLTFNKLGDHPKVLLFVDALRHTSKWTYQQGSKVGHFMGWQDDFVAAEKDNELIKQWNSLFMEYLQADQKKKDQIFERCQLKDNRRSKSNSKELSQDILQCILNRKKKSLQKEKTKKQVCNYYGLWGISEYLGPLKLEQQLSLDIIENDLNPFLWKWSEKQAQMMVGKIRFMARLQTQQLSLIGKLIEANQLKEWGKNDSLLTRTLYSSTKEKIKIEKGKVAIKE